MPAIDEPSFRTLGTKGTLRLVGALGEIRSRRAILLLTGLSLLFCCLIFPSPNWWPLAYVCLVPWLVCVCGAAKARFLYFAGYLLGLGYFLINIRWLAPVTWPGYLVVSAYFALFFPLAAWPIRHLYRRYGLSVALAAPIVWVALEYLRSIGTIGFPWLLLAHSQYKVLKMIQISDLVGAYGVSFVLVMVNGWIADMLLQPILFWRTDRKTRLPLGSLTTLLVVLGTLIYGLAQDSRKHLKPGPRIAMVQHDIPMYVNADQAVRLLPDVIFNAYLALAKRAAAERPDLIVLPETAMYGFINREFLDADGADLEEILKRRYPQTWRVGDLQFVQRMSALIRDDFQRLSTETGIPIVLGSSSLEWKPTGIPPRVDAYNSAFLIEPGQTATATRYDKQHLVLFGEYVPFRYSYRYLYEQLNALTPWGADGKHYSLTPGDQYTVFEINVGGEQGRSYRAGAPICYEEIMPYIPRAFARGDGRDPGKKNIDLLLSISNDGWFPHSSELEQHLAAGVFRAVENRIAVARSVNTGASAMVYPNGKIHSRVMLSEAQVERLDPVTTALEQWGSAVERLLKLTHDDEAYRATWRALNQEPARGLTDALVALGPEFGFLEIRLNRLRGRVITNNTNARQKACEVLRDQIERDLETVQRWRSKPWTAPGYTIDVALLDERVSFYTRFGDWFARGALVLTGLMILDWLRHRLRRKTRPTQPEDGSQG